MTKTKMTCVALAGDTYRDRDITRSACAIAQNSPAVAYALDTKSPDAKENLSRGQRKSVKAFDEASIRYDAEATEICNLFNDSELKDARIKQGVKQFKDSYAEMTDIYENFLQP